MNLGMLEEIEVRELVCGVSSEDEISEVREWIKKMHQIDQDLFGFSGDIAGRRGC